MVKEDSCMPAKNNMAESSASHFFICRFTGSIWIVFVVCRLSVTFDLATSRIASNPIKYLS